jgi:ABC-type multidrug transport system fused ATPase/permease subunit
MKLLLTVLRLPMAWFDATPTGRIINRFSNDINEIDTGIGVGIQNALEQYTSGRPFPAM